MNTEQRDSTRRFNLKKECPNCGQAVGWMRFLRWSLLPTGRGKLQCPGCQTRLTLHSSISTVLLACLFVALLMLRWFLLIYGLVPMPLHSATHLMIRDGILATVIEYLILGIALSILFNMLFVSIKLRGEEA